jgi:hypothetical protein
MKHLLALTKQELQDILLAVQGEQGWLVIHGSPARRRRYRRLERVLEQKLENLEREMQADLRALWLLGRSQ